MIRKALLTAASLVLSAHAALAACAEPRAAAALKIASLQQRLMVAGLACHAGDSYNRFVLAHRAELQRSDDDLKAWFIANGGEAGYDAYKTKMANLAAHGPATDRDAFCAGAAADFRALDRSGDLQDAAAAEALPAGQACEVPIVAQQQAPVRVARNEDVVAAAPRELPAIPYADAPPPRLLPQPVAAQGRDWADVPPRPAARSERYWYYRRLYRDGD